MVASLQKPRRLAYPGAELAVPGNLGQRKVTRTALYVGLRVRARLHKGDRGRAAVADHAAAGCIIAQQLARALALLLHRRPPPRPDAPAHWTGSSGQGKPVSLSCTIAPPSERSGSP